MDLERKYSRKKTCKVAYKENIFVYFELPTTHQIKQLKVKDFTKYLKT